ncbi:hypothetical protein WJX81_001248 [Elliptochloris bilobata]|uniref:t-SNARE coiled-coil homology domain-containing protein n=1 Tax=Elliptochloris bilobata TaxID=381761 RepID=A0AAW1RG16_9CHLO
MNDLLASVKGTEVPGRPGVATEQHDLEAGLPPAETSTNDKQMDVFFESVATIKALLLDIRRKQGELQAAHERSKMVTRTDDMKRVRDQMQDDITEVGRIAHKAKGRLEALDKANEAAHRKAGCGPGSSSERTRTAVTAALKKKLKDIMGDFQVLRQRLNEEYREVVERRVYTVTGERASEAEIDRMIETGESETIFQKAILEQGRGHVLDTLVEIQERHAAVRELERSLLDLHQVFLDMAVLVEAQGEMLDNIESQVSKARDHVESGVTHLVEAKKMQKKTRKLMCCILVTVLIIIALIVILVVKPWNLVNKQQ